MAIDKIFWKELYFIKENLPDIICPVCDKGLLTFIKESFKSEQTKESKDSQRQLNSTDFDIEFRFSSILKCSSSRCGDIVAVLGKGFYEPYYEIDQEHGYYNESTRLYYSPLFFHPSLKIIPVGNDYPKPLVIELKDSFSLFFSDLSSCANKIRICVEVLMDEFSIKKREVKSKKYSNISLHSRILEFKKKNSEVGDYLLAIKWIGNTGSHYNKLTKDDILDAYSLLDFSLQKLFDKDSKIIKKLSKEINKKKAPLSKKKRKTK